MNERRQTLLRPGRGDILSAFLSAVVDADNEHSHSTGANASPSRVVSGGSTSGASGSMMVLSPVAKTRLATAVQQGGRRVRGSARRTLSDEGVVSENVDLNQQQQSRMDALRKWKEKQGKGKKPPTPSASAAGAGGVGGAAGGGTAVPPSVGVSRKRSRRRTHSRRTSNDSTTSERGVGRSRARSGARHGRRHRRQHSAQAAVYAPAFIRGSEALSYLVRGVFTAWRLRARESKLESRVEELQDEVQRVREEQPVEMPPAKQPVETPAATATAAATSTTSTTADSTLVHDLRAQIASLEQRLVRAETDLRDERVKSSLQQADLATLRLDLREAVQEKKALQQQISSFGQRMSQSAQLEARVRQQELQLMHLKQKSEEELVLRRRLHNQVQDMRGKVRVYCRLRPAGNDEATDNPLGQCMYECLGQGEYGEVLEVNSVSVAVDGSTRPQSKTFEYDHVFGPQSTQSELFADLSELVTSAIDGYNVTIFAYGQTGSGKTYTMLGPGASLPDDSDPQRGMIPRSVEQLFRSAEQLQASGWTYSFRVSCLEIYNETVFDLLAAPQDQGLRYDVRMDSDGKVSVSNLQCVPAASPREVHELLRRGLSRRAVGSTAMNARSSRSHTVFQLHIQGAHAATGKELSSVLSLVDLAGSERLQKSQASGTRRKETQMINSSLMSLSQCVSALAGKRGHVPYRNSKLTYLLHRSLGGKSKTAFFVNISPVAEHAGESLCTLRFAQKLKQCELGAAKRNS